MPEAPEVQNVLNYLQEELTGRTITNAEITHPKLSDNLEVPEMENRLRGQTFRRFARHGKYLVFETDDLDWVSHMRMEGKFLVTDEFPEDPKAAKHVHARFDLDDGRMLLYSDTRKFGRMQVYPKAERISSLPVFDKIGPDVLSDEFTPEGLLEKLKKRKSAVKTSIMDQSVVAGIGNIYADEILFDAGLDPRSISSHLDLEDCQKIVQAAKEILGESIRHGGTTIRSFSYGNHEPGSFQDFLRVHQRKDEPCLRCGHEIEQIKVNNRSTYLCPECQKLK